MHIMWCFPPPFCFWCIQVRGSFGSWQGKKFALVHQSEMIDAPPPFALTGAPGTRTRLERPKSAGFHGANTNGQWLLIESICIRVRMYACVYMCMYICSVYVCVCVYAYVLCMYICITIHIHIHIHIHIYIHSQTCVICSFMHICTHTYMYTHTYSHTYSYIHLYIYTFNQFHGAYIWIYKVCVLNLYINSWSSASNLSQQTW